MKRALQEKQAAVASYRRKQFQEHKLKQLFFELTTRCNLRCRHCGSRCGEADREAFDRELTAEEWKRVIDQIAEDFPEKPQINITGGEPLIRSDFEEIMNYVHERGFRWGMTTNATRITPETAQMLSRTGMGTVSISLDGFADSHDRMRGVNGSWQQALEGLHHLLDERAAKLQESRRSGRKYRSLRHIQVTSVFNHESIQEMPEFFEFVKDLDIDSYRIIGIEPIGSAMDHVDLALTPEDQRMLLSFIAEKRREGWPVSYGCSHYLGDEWEGQVRNWLFYCMAGLNIASIMADGGIGACLDIERRDGTNAANAEKDMHGRSKGESKTVFGNIREERFVDVWNRGFGIYRRDRAEDDPDCRDCDAREFCMGGSAHTWDYAEGRQRLCLYKMQKARWLSEHRQQ